MSGKHLHLAGTLPLWFQLAMNVPFMAMLISTIYKFTFIVDYLVYVWFPPAPGTMPSEDEDQYKYPWVTIQLPMYNEHAVYERCIIAATKVRWPKDRLEILVCDDSDDAKLVGDMDALVARLKDEGNIVQVVRRADRSGYKAGALQFSMQQSRGEFIAIFDTDFVVTPDFLERTVPFFFDNSGNANNIGLVQCPWTWLNEHENFLTRAQAIWLDSHFIIEQMVKARTVKLFGFNGTAGIWRRKAIIDGGLWSSDSVTEDADLGYRAHIAGYKFVFVHDLPQACELPNSLLVFKGQQHRWVKGFPQIMLKLLMPLMAARGVTVRAKIDAFFHLMGGMGYVWGFVLILLYPVEVLFGAIYLQYLWVYYSPLIVIGLYYVISAYERERLYRKRNISGCLWGVANSIIPMCTITILFLGISFHTTYAWFEGWFTSDATFNATLKEGHRLGTKHKRKRKVKLHPTTIVELLMVVYLLASCYVLYWEFGIGVWGAATILPFAALGFGLFGIPSLKRFIIQRFANCCSCTSSDTQTDVDYLETIDQEIDPEKPDMEQPDENTEVTEENMIPPPVRIFDLPTLQDGDDPFFGESKVSIEEQSLERKLSAEV